MRQFLRGDPCPTCGLCPQIEGSTEHAEALLKGLRLRWNTTRGYAYAAVFLASLVVSWMPMLSTAVTAAGLILANVVLIHQPSSWLPFQHGFMARSLIRVWFVMMIAVTFLVNLAVAPLIAVTGAGIAASAVTSLVVTALYVEGALGLLERVVRRAIRYPNGGWGWLLTPVGLGVGVMWGATALALYMWPGAVL